MPPHPALTPLSIRQTPLNSVGTRGRLRGNKRTVLKGLGTSFQKDHTPDSHMANTVLAEDFHKRRKDQRELWCQGKAKGKAGQEENLPEENRKWTEKGKA